MLLIEFYQVETSNIPYVIKVLEDQKQAVKEINLSFLKDWATYQCREDPNKFIEV